MKSASRTAPAFFISHGAPTFALEPGLLGPRLEKIGEALSGLKALLVVSPHWQSHGSIRVMASTNPGIVHDFSGFADALYELQYPAPGAPRIAKEVAELLESAGFPVALDDKRPLDHGAWVPLRYLRPKADVPVLQVSLPVTLTPHLALKLGETLRPLRERGVAVLGSGSMTHNLREFRQNADGGSDARYAKEFADWARTAIVNRQVDALLDYRRQAPHAERAHPTEEHYLPLLVALGASAADEMIDYIEGGMTHGVLCMDSYAWGLALQASERGGEQ